MGQIKGQGNYFDFCTKRPAFADDKNTFFTEWKARDSIRISLKFITEGPISNKSALVQITAWHQTGDKPLTEQMVTQFTDASIYQASKS